MPNDTAPEVLTEYPVNFIEVHSLNEVAKKNLQDRYQELVHAEKIIEQNIAEFLPLLKQRRVEVAMREVPEKIKEIAKLPLPLFLRTRSIIWTKSRRGIRESTELHGKEVH